MSLVTRYRLFWAALMAALLGLAFWKNSRRYGCAIAMFIVGSLKALGRSLWLW